MYKLTVYISTQYNHGLWNTYLSTCMRLVGKLYIAPFRLYCTLPLILHPPADNITLPLPCF